MAHPEKDKRLYFTLPNDFHRHPKVERLSDAAFRAFVEMVGEARLADNDGQFERDDAEFMWPAASLEALAKSHPSRPLVVADENGYRLREYAKHQQTKAEREEVARVARENGAKGGRPRKPKGNPPETQGVSEQKQSEPSGTQAKAQSESKSKSKSQSELQTDLTVTGVSQVTNAREILTDSEETPEQFESSRRLAQNIGVNLVKVIERAQTVDRTLNGSQALRLATHILAKSKRQPPGNPMGYIATTFKNSALEVQQWIDTEVMT